MRGRTADGRAALMPAPCIDAIALEEALLRACGPWEGATADLVEGRYGTAALAICARLLADRW